MIWSMDPTDLSLFVMLETVPNVVSLLVIMDDGYKRLSLPRASMGR